VRNCRAGKKTKNEGENAHEYFLYS
jgi:hypothetical protein